MRSPVPNLLQTKRLIIVIMTTLTILPPFSINFVQHILMAEGDLV